jgi:hypothetical protein
MNRFTMRTINIFVFLFFLCALAWGGTEELEKQKKQTEADIENRITTAFNRYFPDLKFLISAEAFLIEEETAGEENPSKDILLPGVKGFESSKKTPQMVISLERVEVHLLVDKYTTAGDQEYLRLIENIAVVGGKLNRVRGDKVNIQEMVLPQAKPSLPAIIKSVQDSLARIKAAEPIPFFSTRDYILFGALLLLLVVIFFMYRMNRKAVMQHRYKIDELAHKQEVQQQENENEKENKYMLMLPDNIQKANEHAENEKLKAAIITTAVGRPDVIASAIKEMMSNEEQKNKLQTVFSQFGTAILAIVKENVSKQEYNTLNQLFFDAPQKNPIEIHEALSFFNNQIQLKQFSISNTETQNPFAFLEKLSEPQLYLLMKDEPPGIIAIILSQLNSAISGNLLRNLPSMHQGDVALELAKLQRLTSDAFITVARDLAAKAAKIPAINNVQVQGTDLLLDIFDNMDENSEHSINEFIKVMNLDLYKKLSTQRISFGSLDTLDEKHIRQLMRDISGEEMALGLKNAPENIRTKFYSVLPTKSKTILQEYIDALDDVPAADEQKIRRRITRLVREYLRTQNESERGA